MSTSNQNAQRIAALLHQTRSPAWTLDQTHELTAAVRGATEIEAKLALLSFTMALLAATKQVLTIQRDASIVEQVVAERDDHGGELH